VNLLRFSNKRAAAILFKVLESAIANAEHNMGLDIEELKVAVVDIGEARSDFRTKARARGRANRITKRNSHILVTVQES
jgi:large subunit ribosomal protein L22